jgi:hypothetical protein
MSQPVLDLRSQPRARDIRAAVRNAPCQGHNYLVRSVYYVRTQLEAIRQCVYIYVQGPVPIRSTVHTDHDGVRARACVGLPTKGLLATRTCVVMGVPQQARTCTRARFTSRGRERIRSPSDAHLASGPAYGWMWRDGPGGRAGEGDLPCDWRACSLPGDTAGEAQGPTYVGHVVRRRSRSGAGAEAGRSDIPAGRSPRLPIPPATCHNDPLTSTSAVCAARRRAPCTFVYACVGAAIQRYSPAGSRRARACLCLARRAKCQPRRPGGPGCIYGALRQADGGGEHRHDRRHAVFTSSECHESVGQFPARRYNCHLDVARAYCRSVSCSSIIVYHHQHTCIQLASHLVGSVRGMHIWLLGVWGSCRHWRR